MSPYDADALRSLASRTERWARFIAIVYALLGLAIGVPAGALVVIDLNAGRRIELVRSRADYEDLTSNKREELHSLLRHTLAGAVFTGAALAIVGFALGRARATSLRLEAQSALCLAQVEANARR